MLHRPSMRALLQPAQPPYALAAWRALPFGERLAEACRAWALQGYGTPPLVYLAYAVKVAVLYAGGWWLFVQRSDAALMSEVALQKAVLWTMAYEVLGFGCGSGPLTGRYFPPLGGALYFARPGTTKLSLFPGAPIIGGHRRSWLDALQYLALIAALGWALWTPAPGPAELWPVAILLPLCSLGDKAVFLAARGEHHYVALLCFLLGGSSWIAGCKWLWLAIWWWAATSKLNRHFPAVVCVMLSNGPLVPAWLRRRLYRAFPADLRPAAATAWIAHLGTAVEYAFPLWLVLASDPLPGLVAMLLFHLFITSCVPMGVPIEWNVIMVYGALFLFGSHAPVALASVSDAPLLVAVLLVALVVVPLAGNLFPARVSFLPAMRYYAGNWAYSIWLFRGAASNALDASLIKSSPHVREQLARLYDDDTIDALVSKVMAFRAMHLHGRALQTLLPKAVDDLEAYEWLDGEVVAGACIGWNFGDGHLHDERLLAAVQAQCRFAPGELRCIFVESQPLFGRWMEYRIADAATGVLERGQLEVAALCERQPWPS